MNREEKISRLSRLFNEDREYVMRILEAEALEKAPTIEELFSLYKELRDKTTVPRYQFYNIFVERHDTLSLEEVESATTREEIVMAYSRTRKDSKVQGVAIRKMAALLDDRK